MTLMDKNVKEVVATKEEIDAVCKRLGEQITKDYAGKEIVLVGLLRGCCPFIGNILCNIDLWAKVDYMVVSSYHGSISATSEVRIIKDLTISIKDKHVIIVDDIIDTGKTLKAVADLLKLKGPASISACVMLDKRGCREEEFDVKYVGIPILNGFVVGYGLDYGEYYRNLPYIGILSEKVYNK